MTPRLLAPPFFAALALLACSSSNNAPLSTQQSSACITSLSGEDPTCASCLETSCSANIATESTNCSDFLSCICPGGTFEALLVVGCESKEQEASCQSGLQAFQACEADHCSSQCQVAGDAGAH